jgi:hypothetical protein
MEVSTMLRSTNGKITIAIIILLLATVSLMNAEPIRLRFGNTRFPVFIDFPTAPQTGYTTNPALASSMIYYFTAQDEDASVAYAVTICSIPANLGSIPKETAQMMIEQSLDIQISSIDAAMGAKGNVIGSSLEPLAGYPSKYLEVVRQTTPRFFGIYRAVFVNRLLVTVWAIGLDTADNRSKAAAFVQSLHVEQ